jgi:ferredoxin
MGQPVTRWHVAVDKGTCIGSAICVGTAPGRFELDAQQRSGPVAAQIAPDEAVRDAAASCPVEAISLVDADTGEPVDLD